MAQVSAYKVDTLVGVKPDSIVALKVPNENKFELYITSRTGVPFPLKSNVASGVSSIINTDGNLTISGPSTIRIDVSPSLLATINSALQAGEDNPTTVVLSSATLNSTYPTAATGFRVYCASIIAGATTYEKTPTGWIGFACIVP